MSTAPTLPQLNLDAAAQIADRGDDAVRYIDSLRSFAEAFAAMVELRRDGITKVVTDGKDYLVISQAVGRLVAAQGSFDCAKAFYAEALVMVINRTDLDLPTLHRGVYAKLAEKFINLASDDACSGRGNDDRRVYRDAYASALRDVHLLDHTPSLRLPRPVTPIPAT